MVKATLSNKTQKNAFPDNFHTEDLHFWAKTLVLLTHGVLWLIAIYGAFILPAIMTFGSRNSYYGEKINRTQWIIFYTILVIYNSLVSIYLSIPGNNKKYSIIGLINSLLVILFITAAFINAFIIFY